MIVQALPVTLSIYRGLSFVVSSFPPPDNKGGFRPQGFRQDIAQLGSVIECPLGTPAYPAPPAPATSLTDRARAEARSSGVCRRGPAPGRPRCTVQPASANPHPLPVPHTHPAGPVRLAVGDLLSNPARLVAICTTAPGRSPTKG